MSSIIKGAMRIGGKEVSTDEVVNVPLSLHERNYGHGAEWPRRTCKERVQDCGQFQAEAHTDTSDRKFCSGPRN